MTDTEELQEIIAGTGWELDDDDSLWCRHGHQVEWDGDCEEGCESILKQWGLV